MTRTIAEIPRGIDCHTKPVKGIHARIIVANRSSSRSDDARYREFCEISNLLRVCSPLRRKDAFHARVYSRAWNGQSEGRRSSATTKSRRASVSASTDANRVTGNRLRRSGGATCSTVTTSYQSRTVAPIIASTSHSSVRRVTRLRIRSGIHSSRSDVAGTVLTGNYSSRTSEASATIRPDGSVGAINGRRDDIRYSVSYAND